MNKTIITVVGKDQVGIIAKVCTYLADNAVHHIKNIFPLRFDNHTDLAAKRLKFPAYRKAQKIL